MQINYIALYDFIAFFISKYVLIVEVGYRTINKMPHSYTIMNQIYEGPSRIIM